MTAVRRRSRLARVEAQKARRSAVIYTVLSIGLLIFFVAFGITILPRIADVVAGFVGNNNSGGVNTDSDTPLAPPQINPISEFTKDDHLIIEGFATPGINVVILHNKARKEILTAADGTYNSTFTLEDGENTFTAFTTDNAGNESTHSRELKIWLDTEEPKLEVVKPTDGQEFFGNNEQKQTIEGYTESGGRITINGRIMVVRSDGGFRSDVSLQDGENKFEIKATDKAGNETVLTVTVKYAP